MFDEKVQVIDEKYRERIDNLMVQNTELRSVIYIYIFFFFFFFFNLDFFVCFFLNQKQKNPPEV